MTRPALPDRAFAAFLFDKDGILPSWIACAGRAWARRAERHGVDNGTAVAPRVEADTARRLAALAG